MENEEDSSTSSEENNDLFKEAASCDYVNKLFHNAFNVKNEVAKTKRIGNLDSESEETTVTSHQLFIAKKLQKRLDHLIELIEHPVCSQTVCSTLKGIRLLNDSVYIDKLDDEVVEANLRPSNSNFLSEKEYFARAEEVAVTFDWISSKTNTSLWRNNKRPKIINLKVNRKLPGEKVECAVISTINIPEKYRLI